MDKFLLKRKTPASAGASSAAAEASPSRKPRIFCSHNVNGFGALAQDPERAEALRAFLRARRPDVFCVQEAKLRPGRTQKFIWDGWDCNKKNKAAAATHDRIQALFRSDVFKDYHVRWSLSAARKSYAGTAVLWRKDLEMPYVRYWLLDDKEDARNNVHDPEGRVLVLHWPGTCLLLNTYAPNNGTKPETWARRRQWDAKLRDFVQAVRDDDKTPLIWVGDLNATSDDHDMDDAHFYRDTVYKRSPDWTDPTERADLDDLDKGQPGCSVNEQRRLAQIRGAGRLVDPFRMLHPPPPPPLPSEEGGSSSSSSSSSSSPSSYYYTPGHEPWTWRGSPGTSRPEAGRYYKRGMRIDYTLVHESLAGRVVRAEVLGHGYDRQGFMGSDHSPILLELTPWDTEEEEEGDPGSKRQKVGAAAMVGI